MSFRIRLFRAIPILIAVAGLGTAQMLMFFLLVVFVS